MKLRYKILLFTSNHISGNLVRLKLKSFGSDVHISECVDNAKAKLEEFSFDLIVLNDPDLENPLISIAEQKSIPLIFISNGKEIGPGRERFSMGLSFTEEEFFHKVSYSVEFKEEDYSVPLSKSVISHYGGDKVLARKVIASFLEGWEAAIEKIQISFRNDDDKALSRHIHSFKGVLSALGESEAASLIRKMEILVKGRSRESAFKIYPELREICKSFAEELELSELIN